MLLLTMSLMGCGAPEKLLLPPPFSSCSVSTAWWAVGLSLLCAMCWERVGDMGPPGRRTASWLWLYVGL